MIKKYTFWLTAAILFQFVSAGLQSVSFFVSPVPSNEIERQLIELTTTYRFDLGSGFQPTYSSLFLAFSSCFTFLCLLGGLTLGYVLFKQPDSPLLKGIIGINTAIFGTMFLVMAVFTFLLPILFSGLIFANLLVAYILAPANSAND